jgi:hypothetical protein
MTEVTYISILGIEEKQPKRRKPSLRQAEKVQERYLRERDAWHAEQAAAEPGPSILDTSRY